MSTIKRLITELQHGPITVGKSEATSIKKYVRNRNFYHPRTDIDAFTEALSEHENLLTPGFLRATEDWLMPLLLDKSGEWRNTAETRKFGNRERACINDYRSIRLVGVHTGGVDTYYTREHLGHEPAKDVYPLWRILTNSGGHLDFIYRPWQASLDRRETGFYFV